MTGGLEGIPGDEDQLKTPGAEVPETTEAQQQPETGPTPDSTMEETNQQIENLLGPQMLAGAPRDAVEPVRPIETPAPSPFDNAEPAKPEEAIPMPAASEEAIQEGYNPENVTDVPEAAEQKKAA